MAPRKTYNRRTARNEILRLVRSTSIAEFSRRSGIPASTVSGWLLRKDQAIPPRSLERAVKAISVGKKKPPIGPAMRRAVAAELVNNAYAVGPDPVLSASRLAASRLSSLAGAVSSSTKIPIGTKKYERSLEAVRRSSLETWRQDGAGAFGEGIEYRSQFPTVPDGQQDLSDAWIAGLQWLFENGSDEGPLGIAIVTLAGLDTSQMGDRPTSTKYSDFSPGMYEFFEWCEELPEEYFIVTYEPLPNDPSIYEVKAWEINPEKENRPKK